MKMTHETLKLYSEKGRYARLGFFITHGAILLIIAGVLLSTFGFKAFMALTEGETSDTAFLMKTEQPITLDFAIRCDSFEARFYENTQRPKEYESKLTIIEKGREILSKTIQVNDPLKYKGVYIYQSSYGADPEAGDFVLRISGGDHLKNETVVKVKIGVLFDLPEHAVKAKITQFVPDFARDEEGRIMSRTDAMKNPAIQITVFKNDSLFYKEWLFSRFPSYHNTQKGNSKIVFTGIEGGIYTGLQLTKSPGLSLIWAGCILLVLGSFMIFLISHNRLWVEVAPADGKFCLTIAGMSQKNRTGFQSRINQLHLKLRKILKN